MRIWKIVGAVAGVLFIVVVIVLALMLANAKADVAALQASKPTTITQQEAQSAGVSKTQGKETEQPKEAETVGFPEQEVVTSTEVITTCYQMSIPEESAAWSNGSLWLLYSGVEVFGEGQRWTRVVGTNDWKPGEMVTYHIFTVQSTCNGNTAIKVNLQYRGAEKSDYFNDVTKAVRWCVDDTSGDSVVAVLFGNDAKPYGWALSLFQNGDVEFLDKTDKYDAIIATANGMRLQ